MNKKMILFLVAYGIVFQNSFAKSKYYQYSTPWFGVTLDIAEKSVAKQFPEWGDLMLRMEDVFKSQDIKIYETKDGNRWGIEIGLPGFEKNDIKISIKEKGILTITAETEQKTKTKKQSDNENNKIYLYESKSSQKKYFSRTFKLPEDVDWQNTKETKVSYEKGILKIDFEKKKEVKAKEITLKIEDKKTGHKKNVKENFVSLEDLEAGTQFEK
ncbi:MAG: Hsp20/alpha crystallin family protein [bacterium]